jgi:hypothetical protein
VLSTTNLQREQREIGGSLVSGILELSESDNLIHRSTDISGVRIQCGERRITASGHLAEEGLDISRRQTDERGKRMGLLPKAPRRRGARERSRSRGVALRFGACSGRWRGQHYRGFKIYRIFLGNKIFRLSRNWKLRPDRKRNRRKRSHRKRRAEIGRK